MVAYFNKMNEIVDGLSMVGCTISHENFVLKLLAGFLLEYDSVVANINSQKTLLDIEEVHALLLSQEIQIQQAFPVELTLATYLIDLQNKKGDNNNNRKQTNGNNKGGNTFRGRKKGRGCFNNQSPSVYCQLCRKSGHTIFKCYNRFDPNF